MKVDDELLAEIVTLTQELVRAPSQIDDGLGGVLTVLEEWLTSQQLNWEMLTDDNGEPVGIVVTVDSGKPGPTLWLDAPIDTAPVGQLDAWKKLPFDAVIESGKLYGRGSADAKVAVSIFCHLARNLQSARGVPRGVLRVLLDGDEHSGRFGGVKALVEGRRERPSFVSVGYPGNYGIVIGARGFYRARVRTYGIERHSGSKANDGSNNAILKMARLITILMNKELPREDDPDFEFGPKLTVTEIQGGNGFSQTPGKCEAGIDVRLTPSFDAGHARALIQLCLDQVNAELPTARPASFAEIATWPAYRLDRDSREVQALRRSAENAFGKRIDLVVCGPSNIGNYLATHGIPATCGFGVTYENQHSADECIEIASIPKVYESYYNALQAWATSDSPELRSAG